MLQGFNDSLHVNVDGPQFRFIRKAYPDNRMPETVMSGSAGVTNAGSDCTKARLSLAPNFKAAKSRQRRRKPGFPPTNRDEDGKAETAVL